MRSPKATPEDPAVVAAREREQKRAETARTEETQALLIGDTVRRLRRFGKMPGKGGGGSVPIYAGSAAATSGGRATGGSSVYSGGTSAGGGSGGFGGGSDMNTVLY